MIELLSVIASLCLIPNGGDSWKVAGYIHNNQLACQQYYVKCIGKLGAAGDLNQCIINKPLNKNELNK